MFPRSYKQQSSSDDSFLIFKFNLTYLQPYVITIRYNFPTDMADLACCPTRAWSCPWRCTASSSTTGCSPRQSPSRRPRTTPSQSECDNLRMYECENVPGKWECENVPGMWECSKSVRMCRECLATAVAVCRHYSGNWCIGSCPSHSHCSKGVCVCTEGED